MTELMAFPEGGARRVCPPWRCSRCGAWFQSGTVPCSCTVDHGGGCCHHFDLRISPPAIRALDEIPQPSRFARFLYRVKQILTYPAIGKPPTLF